MWRDLIGKVNDQIEFNKICTRFKKHSDCNRDNKTENYNYLSFNVCVDQENILVNILLGNIKKNVVTRNTMKEDQIWTSIIL